MSGRRGTVLRRAAEVDGPKTEQRAQLANFMSVFS